MKAILVSMLLAVAGFALAGCETDMPPAREAGNKLERGIRGEGTLYQPDKSTDPIIRENTRVGY